jgi:maltose alpha-D-glucosyltransferase/alpha-amylase
MMDILERTPPIPPDCQWCIFLRNHDELTLEMVTQEEREWMWEQYAPEPRMRLNLGIRRRLASLLDNDRRKIELINSILFTLPGSPIIYYGDEIGMGDNIWLHDRNGVRTPMQWNAEENAGFSPAPEDLLYAPVINSPNFNPEKVNVADQVNDPNSLYQFTKQLIKLRKQFKVLSGSHFEWAKFSEENHSIAAYWRRSHQENILAVHNLSERDQNVKIRIPENIGNILHDAFSGERYSVQSSHFLHLSLKPYQYFWFVKEN